MPGCKTTVSGDGIWKEKIHVKSFFISQ